MAVSGPETKLKIAFVGLGAMGLPMARHLVGAGYSVRGFDLRAERRAELVTAGGLPADTLEQAVSGADVLLLITVNAAQAEDVLFGNDALRQVASDAAVVLMATCTPEAVAGIAARVESAGRRFIDAPVSGGVVGAQAATLTIMAAAPADTFSAIRPVFKAMGDKIFHVGDRPGQATMVKAVNQLLCGVHIAAAAEALSFADKLGIDRTVLLEIVSNSAASSWMLRDRGPRMLQDEPIVTSAVDIFVKDLGIVLDAGRHAKTALPLAALAHQLFVSTSGRGDGAADDSQVVRAYSLLSGADPRRAADH